MKWSHLGTILLGLVLIAILVPLCQFLTQMTVNVDAETSTPVAWAVGIVFSLLLVFGTIRAIARTRRIDKPNMVLLYCMLTVAIPVMNIGLVRQVYMSMQAGMYEYYYKGNNTYRTQVNNLRRDWFPVIPTREGFAWLKADRLLNFMEDAEMVSQQRKAESKLRGLVVKESRARRLREATTQPATTQPTATQPADATAASADGQVDANEHTQALQWVAKLRADQADAFLVERSRWTSVDLKSLDLLKPLRQRQQEAGQVSSENLQQLPEMLKGVDELDASLLDRNWNSELMDQSTRERLFAQFPQLRTPEARQERTAHFADQADRIGRMVAMLTISDRTQLRSALMDRYLQQYAAMPDHEVRAMQNRLVYRMKTSSRTDMANMDGSGGTVNQFFDGFRNGLWAKLQDKSAVKELTVRDRFEKSADELPWHLWAKPIVMWTSLFLAIFMLLMCVSEWLRRKWIDRENLAFPLVEIADAMIRHDADIENAADLYHPQPRKRLVNPVFMVGLLIGLIWVGLEAMGHYGFLTGDYQATFSVSKELFTGNTLKNADKVFLVISPIILGLGFLISLEISFSVWVIFIFYTIIVMIGKNTYPDLKDSLYTGWAGGKGYPFPMAQMLGASLCFSAIVLFKTFRGSKQAKTTASDDYFIPPRLNFVGMVVLPIVILALLWHHGVGEGVVGVLFIALIGLLAFVQMITAARVRAETGLHTQHVSYEFTKIPMIFGMTGLLGSRIFSLFVTVAFLPLTLLFRTIPQHLENMELARRNKLRLRTVAVASLTAFIVAVVVGMVVLPLWAYAYGGVAYGESASKDQGPTSFKIARYSLWNSHFLGEEGLDQWTKIHWIRIWFMLGGFGVVAVLSLLRSRFLRFPLHPIGYLLILLSIYYAWVSPYYKGSSDAPPESSWLWGSIFLAWLLKKVIIKYGGMNTYRRAKPFFIGLVVGAVLCVFLFNATDLVCSLIGADAKDPGGFIKPFLDKHPFSPAFY